MSPSFAHETLVRLFRERPQLAAELARDALHVPVAAFKSARVDDGQLGAIAPTELQADLVVRLQGERPLAIIVEVQLSRDPTKQWSWPAYVASLRSRTRSDVLLVVVTIDAKIAEACARPIDLGNPGSRLIPLVVSPDVVPRVTDLGVAIAAPELAVLSAMAHGGDPEGERIGRVALLAATRLDDERGSFYTDAVLAGVNAAARVTLEAMMAQGTYQYQSDYARRYFGEGKAEGKAEGKSEGIAEGQARGKAEAVIAVLSARGLPVSEALRARILGCSDLGQIDAWLARAVTADSAADALGE